MENPPRNVTITSVQMMSTCVEVGVPLSVAETK